MEVGNLITLYTSLFVTTIAVAGIAIGGVIALTQVLQPILSFKSTQNLIKGKVFKITIFAIVVCLLLTAIPMILLTISSYNLLRSYDLGSYELLTSPAYLVIAVTALLFTLGLLVWLIYVETRYLVPDHALKFIQTNTDKEKIKEYFITKYAEPPSPMMKLVRFLNFKEDEEEKSEEEEKAEEEKAEREYKQAIENYEKNKKKADKLDNPLLPIESYLIQSIRRNDNQTLVKSLKTYEEVIIACLEDDTKDKYSTNLVQYYKATLENAIELAASLGLYSIVLEILDSTQRLTTKLVDLKKFGALNKLQELWREQADANINSQPQIFKMCMAVLRDTGERIMRNKKIKLNDSSECLDNIFRSLGWIGERYLANNTPEKRAIMNSDYQTEFNALMNAVLAFGWEYQRERVDEYPLIYFDCLYVICKRLVKYYDPKDEETHDISDTLFSLMYEHDTFGQAAIRAKNVSGASLALRGLNDHLTIFREAGFDELVKYTLESILRLGAFAASQDFTEASDFISLYGDKTFPEAVIEKLEKGYQGEDLSKEAREIMIKIDFHKNYEATQKYLIEVEKALNIDFGMNLGRKKNNPNKSN